MHNNWEEMIPYYVAGTLPKLDTTRLENHLARCAECRKSLAEWRSIAAVVRGDAASQLRDLPPLSVRVLRVAAQQAGSRRSYQPRTFFTPPPPEPPVTRYSNTSVTLVAAVFTVLLFGALLTFMVLRGTLPRGTEGVVLMPTSTISASPFPSQTLTQSPQPQIIVIEPSPTPVTPTQPLPTSVPATVAVPTQVIPTRVLPTRAPPTSPLPATSAPPLPTDTLQTFAPLLAQSAVSASAQTCIVRGAVPGSSVNMYAGPGSQYAVINAVTQDDAMTALALSDSGWYRVQYSFDVNQWVGWVRQDQVYTSGNCDSLPRVAGAQAPTEAPPTLVTPTPYTGPPIVIISADSINLRSGPGTDYPIVGMAWAGDRFPVSAQAFTSNGVWYLVTQLDTTPVWVAAGLVHLLPADALIAPVLTMPPPPTTTVIPFMSTLTQSPTPSETPGS